MGYVENNLLPGETILYKASIHWIIYAPGACFIALAVVLYFVTGNSFGGLMALLGLVMLVKAHIQRKSTEFVVTNKRVIAKAGWVARASIEMNHNKIESILLDQTVMGRILNYGTLSVHGTGSGLEAIGSIENPLDFRNKAMQAIEESKNRQ